MYFYSHVYTSKTHNTYIQEGLLENQGRRKSLIYTMNQRLENIQKHSHDNHEALELVVIERASVEKFGEWFATYYDFRKKARQAFKGITRKDNIPFVVPTPDTEAEIAALVQECIALGLTVIPRGGGTGYTGGAVPLDAMSVVINTENLEDLSEI